MPVLAKRTSPCDGMRLLSSSANSIWWRDVPGQAAHLYQVRLDNGKYLRVTKTNSLRGDPDAISWDETVWASWAGTSGSVLTS